MVEVKVKVKKKKSGKRTEARLPKREIPVIVSNSERQSKKCSTKKKRPPPPGEVSIMGSEVEMGFCTVVIGV